MHDNTVRTASRWGGDGVHVFCGVSRTCYKTTRNHIAHNTASLRWSTTITASVTCYSVTGRPTGRPRATSSHGAPTAFPSGQAQLGPLIAGGRGLMAGDRLRHDRRHHRAVTVTSTVATESSSGERVALASSLRLEGALPAPYASLRAASDCEPAEL
jgi:hypothetical protein